MKMRRIITYSDLSCIADAPYFQEIADIPQIAMSSEFQKSLTMFTGPKTSFSKLFPIICSSWESRDSVSNDLLLVSRFIHSRLEDATDDKERIWLTGCLKNSFDILSAIRLLIEADVSQNDLADLGKNTQLLCEIWSYLEKNSETARKFKDAYNDASAIAKTVSGLLRCDTNKSIIIHGFFFITPKQDRVIRSLESEGYDLIFLFQYDETYRYANSIWELLYCPGNGFTHKDSWISYGKSVFNAMGEILNGHSVAGINCSLVRYPDVVSFIESIDADDHYFSNSANDANRIFMQFHPELGGERSLLSYPVGRFIDALCAMWDDETMSIIIESESVKSCFVSGWLSIDGLSSNDYVNDLIKILPFFRDCHTLKEWNDRLEYYNMLRTDVISKFAGRSDKSTDRWDRFMGNPLCNIGFFDIPEERLDTVIKMLNRLLGYVENLFDTATGARITTCLEKLEGIMDIQQSELSDLRSEYEAAASILESICSSDTPEGFMPCDMVSTIRQFISHAMPIEDPNTDGRPVKQMYDIESVSSGQVHICLCDSSSMPGGTTRPVWPLTVDVLETIEQRQYGRDEKPLISDTLFIINNAPISNRYLLYRAFFCDHVTLSWISARDRKELTMSPYMRLIESMSDAKMDIGTRTHPANDVPEPAMTIEPASYSDIFRHVDRQVIDPWLEFSICPRRFMNSYILAEHPSYPDSFNQSFIIGSLMRSLYDLGCDNMQTVQEQVLALFPYLLASEIQQIKESSSTSSTHGHTEYNGHLYTNKRLDVEHPFPLRIMMTDQIVSVKPDESVNLSSTCSRNEMCWYCPHSLKCSRYTSGVNRWLSINHSGSWQPPYGQGNPRLDYHRRKSNRLIHPKSCTNPC